MIRTFRSTPWLWLVWAALLLAVVVLQPATSGLAFWLLVAVAAAATLAQMVIVYRRATWEQQTLGAWRERLVALGAQVDIRQDDGAFDLLDAEQWEDILARLAQMPAGTRSLRRAILAVHPGALH